MLRQQTFEHFSSRALGIHSFHCRDDNRAFGPEEVSHADQLVFVRCGAWEMRAGGETHLLDPHSVVLFRRGETYSVRHPLPGGDRCTVLSLRGAAARELLDHVDTRPDSHARRRTRILSSDPRTFLAHHLVLAHLRSAADPCAVEEASLAFAAALLRQGSTPARGERRPVRARTARLHAEIADEARCVIGARFKERLSLSDVAESVLWSPYHFARVFRRSTGLPVHRYVTRLRLRFAIERVAEGRRSLADVAAEAGFSSQGHFGTAFRAEFGLTPGVLRRGIGSGALRQMSKILEDGTVRPRETRPRSSDASRPA